ncbi:MAG: ATP-binding protein [bacterium]
MSNADHASVAPGNPQLTEASSAVFLIDPGGIITGWSPGAAGVTGYTAAEIVGRAVSVLYAPEELADGHPFNDLARAARGGRADGEGWLVRKDSRRVWIETVLTSLRDEHGKVSGFACHARDLAAQRAAEARRRARAEQLSALAVTRQDVAAFGFELAELLPRIVLRARELTAAEAAVIELRDGVGERGRAYDGISALDIELGAVLVPHGPTSGARLQCIRYDDRHESPEVLGDVCDRLGIGAMLAIPILHDRATIGWLAVASRSSRAFDEQQASTLSLMATLLGAPVAHAQASEARRTLLTERARAQIAQRESEARFRAAMDASLDALFIVGVVRDARGAIIDFALLDANRRAEELCTLDHGNFAGRRLSELPAVARQLAPAAVMASIVASGAPLEQERESIDSAGRVRWIQEQIVPLGDGVTITVRDITARVEADAEVRRARVAAEAANLAKSEFVAKMSHELRTPLNSVIGFSNILLRNKQNAFDDTDIAYLSRVNAAGTHLLGLINDVLDIAKIEAGRMELEMAPVDVVAVARQVLLQLETHSHASGLSLTLETSAASVIVNADAGKLHQVLLNVVGNAVKFTPSGGVTVRILVDESPNGMSRRRIEISDTGIGIPADRLVAVFTPFEQAESSTSRHYGGTGLGLSISRALCDAMDFRIDAESELGVGTTFRIELFP